MIPVHWYLYLGTGLFTIGVIGVLTRRNVIIILMSIELILNAVNLNLVAFSRIWGLHGQVFSIFIITDAAAEAAVGLGILIAFFRNKETDKCACCSGNNRPEHAATASHTSAHPLRNGLRQCVAERNVAKPRCDRVARDDKEEN